MKTAVCGLKCRTNRDTTNQTYRYPGFVMFHLSPDLFYGSPGPESRYLETPRKVDPRIFLKQRRTPLLSPSRTFKVFDRQDEALAFVKSRPGNNLMTFVVQSVETGCRTFLVAHPKEFWVHDIEKEKSHRCSYEVIPEFSPCKLYLDLEFETEFNPNCDGIKMTEIFIKLVAHRLFQLYHLKIDRTMILDLDSTTDKKFSRHLIYQIPFLCFASNYEVGLLIQEICTWIRVGDEKLCSDVGITEDELKSLIVKDRHGKDKLFCDEGVYSKNRHFRVYGSTKPHKNSHLQISPQNEYTVPISDDKLRDEAIFLASLVTNFEPVEIIVPLPERGFSKFVRSKSSTPSTGATGGSKNLPSPFPSLDQFALKEMTMEGIRNWVYFSSTNCLVYESYRPGFCGNIGRQHKSNKGMLVVDLLHHRFYRKCHDFECSGYQSEAKPLPSYIVTSLQHPECSEEQRKEIKDLLEFLETQDVNVSVLECSQSSVNSDMQELNLLDLSQNSTHSNASCNSQYETEVKDIIEFLESQPDLDIM
ncbi:hypothetical protein B566_EDAN013219 [Ephemera danica]|nr:hypothetical protein B566_EDAN013219 [Ephemera danica]